LESDFSFLYISNSREPAEVISNLENKATKAVLKDDVEAGDELLAAEMTNLVPRDIGETAERSSKPG